MRMTKPDEKLSVIEEQLVIDKRAVIDGRVRVTTKTEFVTEKAEARLDSENVEVTRVAIGREVSEAPAVRTDGDVTIIPVMEEVLVVEKRLMLVEEIHIRRVATTDDVSIPVELRKQRATIERDNP
ncbi:YsnF/AvaK domain-containing protein [Ochrobactrum intermedium]|nr:YsnF/AvaK domain-containing protein [Brucella intermedia]